MDDSGVATTREDAARLKAVFARYPSGVTALAARIEDDDHVLVASSLIPGVSLAPPLVAVSIQKSSTTWPCLRRASLLGLSLLSEAQSGLCRQLASPSRSERWDGIDAEGAPTGAILIGGAAAWLECSLHAEHEAGDHWLVLLRAETYRLGHDTEPLIYHGSGFRRLATR